MNHRIIVTGAFDITQFDPIEVNVWGHLLAAIAEEMGATLERTAFSPNIKDRLDHSCAIFDSDGQLLAQAAHIPVHLGAMPLMMRALLTTLTWRPGDMWLCNAPNFGGTHLPDITLIAPIYHELPKTKSPIPSAFDGIQPIGFVASRAHHADIGGISPGSLPMSTEIFQEGLILPPVRLVRDGELQREILDLVCANSRTGEERNGDLQAQIAANATGARRFGALVQRYGLDKFRAAANDTLDYSAEMVKQTLMEIPAGRYHAIDWLELETAATNARIEVTITVGASGSIHFDFNGTSSQTHTPLNATEAITRSACLYVVRCMVNEDIPTNEGCFRPVTVNAPSGTLLNASHGAAVAAGNVETSQRIVDVILQALASAMPQSIPADSQGTMNNLTIGGWDPVHNRRFAYYETICGGAGASPHGPGFSAIQCHMTNTRNTPVETLESHYPLRVLEYSIREDCPNNGLHQGGAGVVRRIELLAPCTVSVLSERRSLAPHGLAGGASGACGKNIWHTAYAAAETMPARFTRNGQCGDIIEIRTPGGGGWGR